ncbi:MAG: RNA methyltransferase [Bacteroidales bacterium]|nr:RNA methyltransferase [Bacteroidales bacterium]
MKKLSMEELHRVTPEQFKSQDKYPLVMVLDNIRSMNNIGSIFRTCDAMNVEKLYLCGITACPPQKEIAKTALGATESVNWEYVEDVAELVRRLKEEQYTIAVVEQTDTAVMLQQVDFKQYEKLCLIVGNEVFGVTDAVLPLADLAVEIPQFGTKHSLNVTIAAGIVLWEAVRQIALL